MYKVKRFSWGPNPIDQLEQWLTERGDTISIVSVNTIGVEGMDEILVIYTNK